MSSSAGEGMEGLQTQLEEKWKQIKEEAREKVKKQIIPPP